MERIDSETESLVSYRSQRSQRSAYRREPTARGTYFTSVGLLLVLSRVVLYLAPSFTLLALAGVAMRRGGLAVVATHRHGSGLDEAGAARARGAAPARAADGARPLSASVSVTTDAAAPRAATLLIELDAPASERVACAARYYPSPCDGCAATRSAAALFEPNGPRSSSLELDRLGPSAANYSYELFCAAGAASEDAQGGDGASVRAAVGTFAVPAADEFSPASRRNATGGGAPSLELPDGAADI